MANGLWERFLVLYTGNMVFIWWGLIPFLLLVVLLLFLKRSLLVSASLFFLATVTIALLVWFVYPSVMVGALLKGLFVSLDIAVIIAGSLFFLDVLKKVRVISSLEHYLHRLSPDSRVQALLLAWFFGGIIEGAAGFGAPALVVAPLLVHLGFPVLTAATLALVANTVPVSFGAVGTPIAVGLNGVALPELWLPGVLLFGASLALVVPFLLVYVLHQDVSVRRGVIGLHGLSHRVGDGDGRPSSILPFALWCGLSFAIPFYWLGRYNSATPTLIAALFGLVLTFVCSHLPWWRKLCLPRVTQRLDNFDPNKVPLTLLHTLLPYVLMLVSLLAVRRYLPTFTVQLPGDISHTLSLSNPGLILLLLGGVYAISSHSLTRIELVQSSWRIVRKMLRTAATILLLVAAAQILIHSPKNIPGLPSMISGFDLMLNRENILIISPLLGYLGAALAGSVTLSNLMLGQIQLSAASSLGVSVLIVLCLQLFGATAGNAMALINISALEGVLNLKHQVRPLLRKLIMPIGLYLISIILLAVLWSGLLV